MTRKFTKDHEWIELAADGTATVGITNYAQGQLGDIVFVELPTIGRSVKTGEGAAVVESVKAASDVYAPLSGEVIAVNADLSTQPELVNSVPESGGWFMKLRLADASEANGLMDKAAYDTYIAGL